MPRADYTRVTVGAKSELEYGGRRGEEPRATAPLPISACLFYNPIPFKNTRQLKGTDCNNLEATKPLTVSMLKLINNIKIFYSCIPAREQVAPILCQIFL
jgi:hypothetical protein